MFETVNPLELQKLLATVMFPTSKRDLIHAAEMSGTDQNILDALRDLAQDSFHKPTDITRAIYL